MKNRIIREFDKQGRINIPVELCELCNISPNDILLLVQEGEDSIFFAKMCELDNITKPIIGKIKLVNKGRVVIPIEFRTNDSVEIFYQNGYIYLK